MSTDSAPKRAMTATDRNGGRVYVHPVTGEEFRSVTTILNAAAKPALDKWKVKTISTFAAENREMLATMSESAAFELIKSSQFTSSGVAAAIGDAVHARLEDLFRKLQEFHDGTDSIGATLDVLSWMDQNPPGDALEHVDKCFRELLEEFEIRPLWMEETIFNRSIGYAGSADLIAEIRKRGTGRWKRAVIDAKSGKSIYGSVALQLVAYAKGEALLFTDGTEERMPVIHETYALHVRPRSWALRPMRYDAGAWRAFQSLVVSDQWITFEERRAVGNPVNRGALERQRSYNARYQDGGSEAA